MKKDCRVVIQVTATQKDNWKQALDKTVYTTLSDFIRAMMDAVSSGILDLEDDKKYGVEKIVIED